MTDQAVSHAATAQRYTNTPCDLDLDADWPYECTAKDEYQNTHNVIVCRQHFVWWHEKRTEVTA